MSNKNDHSQLRAWQEIEASEVRIVRLKDLIAEAEGRFAQTASLAELLTAEEANLAEWRQLLNDYVAGTAH